MAVSFIVFWNDTVVYLSSINLGHQRERLRRCAAAGFGGLSHSTGTRAWVLISLTHNSLCSAGSGMGYVLYPSSSTRAERVISKPIPLIPYKDMVWMSAVLEYIGVHIRQCLVPDGHQYSYSTVLVLVLQYQSSDSSIPSSRSLLPSVVGT